MGMTAAAACTCGYRMDIIFFGFGMQRSGDICVFPGHCSECSEIVMLDLCDRPYRCSKHPKAIVLPYDDESLIAEGGRVVAGWHVPCTRKNAEVTDGRHLCPACGAFELRFSGTGIIWD